MTHSRRASWKGCAGKVRAWSPVTIRCRIWSRRRRNETRAAGRSLTSMQPIVSTELVNGPFGDPALFLDFRFERRALLFDLGDIAALPAKKILRLSDVFVTHAHMDHFSGFDRLLRICLGRDTDLRLYGPPGIIDKVEHKLL